MRDENVSASRPARGGGAKKSIVKRTKIEINDFSIVFSAKTVS
jgi:hypothetical protein